jgi:SAM domain (Sterile alpha motif)
MDVEEWLRSLGLGRYEAAFRENEIDDAVLPSLTEEHLKQLGVTALGHRVKLLDAIAALRTDTGVKSPLGVATVPAPSASPEERAERRQVTVMFSDLVVRRRSLRVWILKTSATSSQAIRSVSPRPCSVLAGS